MSLAEPPPLSLYIHIPWCVRKCPYCDFNSHEARDGVPEADYVTALKRDIETALPLVWGRKVVSVFFGGGTPSLFSARAVDDILTAVRTLLPLEPLAEITLEANPGTAEAQKFADFRSAGVNRLSLGIQSFNARHLQLLGRIHDGEEARRAVELAQRHFDNINLDLMYALPEQGMSEMLADLRSAIAFGPQHLSAYHLTLEPNTRFFLDPPALPDDDLAAEMQEAVQSELASAGYEHYETSGFALAGRRCKHNLNYWLFGDYLGIGAGAHGKLTQHDGVLRQVRYKQPKAYLEHALKGVPVQEEHCVAAKDLGFEFMMNALRLTEGFSPNLFEARTGLPLVSVLGALDEAERRGLVERSPERIKPTELGRRFLNELLQGFLPDGE
ncbi:MAG: radical SAM family heme chaperone HemW [Gammaproteobacteria bacterium]|nr:radical SAM family heme chaperone HemW [Gammaproteobacteria bacterium]MBU1731655.1 radical SAM family heme chaperone HemW [Gammaproteobacteria bacterium]MBU1892677.1 radical SAM family heme chaperone HemW [Gammaproteobacteria bacterium]